MIFDLFKPKAIEQKVIIVDCSFSCPKEKCPKWVVLNQIVTLDNGNTKTMPEGRCAIAWIPSLIIELKQAIRQPNTQEPK